MIQRKIQLVGNRSYSISLPKEWIKQNNLKEKDIINIEITKNNDLLVSCKDQTQKQPVHLQIEKDTPIINLIFLCYNRNINELVLTSSKFDIEQKKEIKKAVSVLEGYNIIEESTNHVKIIGINQLFEYDVKKLIKRIIYLIQLSYDSLKLNDKTLIEENEKEINRYYHLCKRILIRSITDSSLRQQNLIKDTVEIFLWNSIIKKLENIGDIVYDMFSFQYSEKTYNIVKNYINSLSDLFNGNDGLDKIITLINRHIKLNNRIKSIEGRVHLLFKDILDSKIELNLNKLYFS